MHTARIEYIIVELLNELLNSLAGFSVESKLIVSNCF